MKIHELPSAKQIIQSVGLNCHECGEHFSPLICNTVATDHRGYYLGTYCRLFIIYEILENKEILCECQKKRFETEKSYTIWLYDEKDDMRGKVIFRDSKEE